MNPRLYTKNIRNKLKKFPAVAILGPRQCGKTTLAKKLGGHYFDMEIEGSRVRLDAEWDTLAKSKKLIVIDEAQQAPDVFSRLRGTIDADRKRNGRFLLLGSVSPLLMKNVSESLAGRLGLIEMTPLILPEIKSSKMDDLWLRGGYPDGGILDAQMFPEWQHDYLDTLVSRDLPLWGFPAKPQQTMRLLSMLAALNGQVLNASQIGAALGLDHKTILSHCDYLEGAFLFRNLQPFYANCKKRLVKRPRLFWRDSGLLHGHMNITSLAHLYLQPWLGHSWEGFVIEQTLASLALSGKRVQPYFFRTSDGYELDLLLDWGTERWGIEIKLTSNPSNEMIARLHTAADLIGVTRRILICRVARKIENKNLLITNLASWTKRILKKGF